MEFPGSTFVGPAPDDPAMLEAVPAALRAVLDETNGFVAFRGGLHVRGACTEPAWHSLREAWRGQQALHRRYPAVLADDVPFAEDAVGDQWLLRDGAVVRLYAETGELEPLNLDVDGFWDAVRRDPVETLGLHPLLQFEQEGGTLQPGQLLNAYPPFATEESRNGVRLAAVPAAEQLDWLAQLAATLSTLDDGGSFEVRASD